MAKKIIERELTVEETSAIAALCNIARKQLDVAPKARPEKIVATIGAFIDAVRGKKVRMPRKGSDFRMALGALWGEQLRAKTAWQWVHVTYPSGFASFGLVPKDRACACFPLNDIPEQLDRKLRDENTSILLFNMIVAKRHPHEKKASYTPFG